MKNYYRELKTVERLTSKIEKTKFEIKRYKNLNQEFTDGRFLDEIISRQIKLTELKRKREEIKLESSEIDQKIGIA